MPESKMDPNAPRVGLGEALASRRSKIGQESPPTPTKSDYDKMYASLTEYMDLKKFALMTSVADGGLGSRQAPTIDAIDQVTKLNAAIGPNYNAMLKDQREALIVSENARTQAEKREADLRYEMLSRAIADVRAESQTVVRNIEEIIKKNQPQPGNRFLFGMADEATGGKYTQQYLDRTFGQPAAPTDPVEVILGATERAEALLRKMGRLPQQQQQERIPLEEDINYHRLVLENERLTKADQQKLEIEKKRAESINTFAVSVTQGISDLAAALMAKYSGGGKKEQPAPVQNKTTTQPQAAAVEYSPINCPNPACGKSIPWLKNAPAGSVGECPYCHVAFSKDDEEEKTA